MATVELLPKPVAQSLCALLSFFFEQLLPFWEPSWRRVVHRRLLHVFVREKLSRKLQVEKQNYLHVVRHNLFSTCFAPGRKMPNSSGDSFSPGERKRRNKKSSTTQLTPQFSTRNQRTWKTLRNLNGGHRSQHFRPQTRKLKYRKAKRCRITCCTTLNCLYATILSMKTESLLKNITKKV